ncbi:phosphopantetheine-binding protein [Streptomyces griseus]
MAGHPGHPSLLSAVVSAPGARTQQRLVAHVVLADPGVRDDPDFADRLCAHLADTLASCMIQSDVVLIDEMPQCDNGKVARSPLPDPRRAGSGGDTDARTPGATRPEDTGALRTLLILAADLPGVESPGVRDNFFELGGDSIMGVQFVGRANAEGIPISPQNLFESTDFHELALTVPAEAVVDDTGTAVPLTPHQERARTQTGTVVLDVPDTFDRSGPAAPERPRRPPPALRTRVRAEGGRWFAVRHDRGEDSEVPEIDLGALFAFECARILVAEHGVQPVRLLVSLRLAKAHYGRPFDLPPSRGTTSSPTTRGSGVVSTVGDRLRSRTGSTPR